MKQTAVEFLLGQMFMNDILFSKTVIEQALEMEKEQIINAFNEGESLGDTRNYTGTIYYNETYSK